MSTTRTVAWSRLGAACLALALAPGCGGSGPKPAEEPEAEAEDYEIPTSRRATAPDIGEEEDDSMAVEGLGGRLDVYDIQRGVEPHAQALSDCFTSRVGRRRYLGGSVEIAFVVHPDGSVKSAHMQKSDLGAWPMEQCMLEVSRGMQFAEPEGNAEADFTVPLSFDARQGVATWDEARTRTEVSDKVAELAACAEDTEGAENIEDIEDPRNVRVTLYVGTRGKVLSAGFASAGPLDDAWAECATGVITAWTLTDPRGRVTKAAFSYNAEQE